MILYKDLLIFHNRLSAFFLSFFFAVLTFDWSLAIFIFGSSLDDDWFAVLLPLLGIVLLESSGLVLDDEDDLDPMLLSAGYWDLK